MLTPRQHAVVATLTGVAAGVAILGAVLVVNSLTGEEADAGTGTTPVVSTQTPGTPADGPLQIDSLQYSRKTLDDDGTSVAAEVPATWINKPVNSWHHRYVDSSDTWMIRFDTKASKKSPERLARDKQRTVGKSVKDFKVVYELSDTRSVSWNPDKLSFTTLAFTYTNLETGQPRPRIQLSRWISVDGGQGSALEITVAGRPQDKAGLGALLDHATETLGQPES